VILFFSFVVKHDGDSLYCPLKGNVNTGNVVTGPPPSYIAWHSDEQDAVEDANGASPYSASKSLAFSLTTRYDVLYALE
jgi:hypothetical protein